MHMFDARDERRISGNLFDSMHAFIYDVLLLYEGKSEDIFTFNQNPAFWRKSVSEPVLKLVPRLPGTQLFTLLRNIPEDDVLACPRSRFRN